MVATSITVPVMMVLAFLPMLSMFNETIKKVAKFFFSQQLHMIMNNLDSLHIGVETMLILVCNIVVVLVVFVMAYRKLAQGK